MVKEIENVDQALYNQGFVDVSIGNVGLERLKKTAHTMQVAQTIPSLLYIIPYFEVSQNQEYVVQRIRGKQINNNGRYLYVIVFPRKKFDFIVCYTFIWSAEVKFAMLRTCRMETTNEDISTLFVSLSGPCTI